MKRAFDPDQPELMDVPQPISHELECDLENLSNINRYFGGHRLIRHFAKCWLKPGQNYRILDLATGPGDIPRMLVAWARERNITVKIDAVDVHASTIEIARGRSLDFPEINFLRGDARTYCDAMTYDLVCCSLALHHFSELDAIKILRRACELSHDKVLVSDLERSRLTWLGIYLLTELIFKERMTKHDGMLSVARSFSFQEMNQLAQQAGWRGYGHCRFWPARQVLWMSGKEDLPAADFGRAALDFAT